MDVVKYGYQTIVKLWQTAKDPAAFGGTEQTKPRGVFTLPPHPHFILPPPPQQQNSFCFPKVLRGTNRKQEGTVKHFSSLFSRGALLPCAQVMTVGPLRPVLSWIWEIFSAMAMRGLNTAWKRKKDIISLQSAAAWALGWNSTSGAWTKFAFLQPAGRD